MGKSRTAHRNGPTAAGNAAPASSVENHHSADAALEHVAQLLQDRYRALHPRASIAVKRYNPVAIRIRILDPDFADTLFTRRDAEVWKILDELPEVEFLQVGMVICLTPQEAKSSFANMEFEAPSPVTE